MPERLILERDLSTIALTHGARTMTALLRATLGPLARTVAISGVALPRTPEIFDSGATIARRTVQLEDSFADMGAMVIRNLA